MREIKFRAWPTHDSHPYMVHWDLDNGENRWSDNDGSFDGWEVMQYTGLDDKNGREIYEGDLLVYRDTSGSGRPREFPARKIRWHRDSCNFNVSRPGNGAEMEVIGNIHENPELLEGP